MGTCSPDWDKWWNCLPVIFIFDGLDREGTVTHLPWANGGCSWAEHVDCPSPPPYLPAHSHKNESCGRVLPLCGQGGDISPWLEQVRNHSPAIFEFWRERSEWVSMWPTCFYEPPVLLMGVSTQFWQWPSAHRVWSWVKSSACEWFLVDPVHALAETFKTIPPSLSTYSHI